MMRKFVLALSVAALAAGGSTACATKGFVRNRVGEVNDKVESVSRSLEETQERTRKNEAAITEANQKIVQVDQRAAAANDAAANARTAADTAANKADAVDKATKRIVYEVTLSEDQGNFKLGQAQLPDEAKARLDEVVKQLKDNPNGAYLEVEGYTDNRGPKEFNEKLGLDRAEAVKRYLYEQHQIPLHRISVISYGPDKPIAPNTTREGRAKNRRVVIKVLV
jgi:peptidoglycan-associated lipoprotein